MASSYTTNLTLEQITVGEQTGSWGPTLNNNWALVDEAVNGITSVSLTGTPGTSGSPNDYVMTEGTSATARHAHIEFTGAAGAAAYVRFEESSVQKLVYIKNSLSDSYPIHVFQGTYSAGRAYIVYAGRTAKLGFEGSGVDADSTVSNIFTDVECNGLAMPNATNFAWANAAGDNEVTLSVDGSDDWIFTTNSVVSLKYDLSATKWDFQANDIATTGAVTGASFAATGTVTGSNLSGTNTGDELVATTSQTGTVTIADQTETDAGTDADKPVTPATLSSYSGINAMTTKGDLQAYSTVKTRLAGSGTDEYVLTYDSAQPTGLKWAPPASAPQRVWNKAVTIELPTTADDVTVFFTQEAITVTEIRSVAIGTTPSVQWSMYHGLSRASGNLIVQVTTTSETTGDDTTSFTDATIPADSFVWIEVDAVTGTSNQVSATMIGTVDL